MNEERTGKCSRQVEHIRGHLRHRYFIKNVLYIKVSERTNLIRIMNGNNININIILFFKWFAPFIRKSKSFYQG
jgi:hypothetical protein